RAQAGLHLRGHARLEAGEHGFELVRRELADDRVRVRVVRVEPGDVGEDHQLRGAEGAGQCGGGAVGVDVVDGAGGVRGDAGDHRDAPGGDDVEHGVRVHRDDVADQPDVDGLPADERRALLGGEQVRVFARQTHGVRAVLVD